MRVCETVSIMSVVDMHGRVCSVSACMDMAKSMQCQPS